ncbi:hypothetical protein RQP46_000505 [Phenoliferia psychrophenolica]
MFPPSFAPTTTVFPSPEAGSLASPTSVFALHHQPPKASKNVLVLLHGYPQNHTLWYEFVASLAPTGVLDEWHIIVPDLPGYGQSRKEASPDGSHSAHCKRAIAADIVATVDHLVGPEALFVVVGHDRGARVGYRMAKDFPARVRGVCLQDIVPTKFVFRQMSYEIGRHQETFKSYHWIVLALPSPLPETLFNGSTVFFESNIDSWTGSRFKGKFTAAAKSSWVDQYLEPAVVTGALEDYRAGASIDLDHDEADEKAGTAAVLCPLLALYSVHLSRRFDVDAIWKDLGKASVRSVQVGDEQTGHFLPIEAVEDTVREVVEWMKAL